MTHPAVLTVGHSTRTLDELLLLIEAHHVARLADVRRFPASRRHPHFSRPALAAALAEHGVEYVHLPDLGGRRAPRPGSPNTAWRVAAFQGYADHMATPAFQSALARLIADAARRRTAVLCAEAVPWRCHRHLLADALVARGVAVLHILGPGAPEPHALDPKAQLLPDGSLVYPGRAGPGPRSAQLRLPGMADEDDPDA